MINAYVNYPNSRGSMHTDAACAFVGMHRKAGQRRLRIDASSFAVALNALADMPFRAEAEANDLWLEVEFNDLAFERAVVEFVVRQLGSRYRPLARIELERHC